MGTGALVSDERVASNGYQLSLDVEPDGRDVIEECLAQVASWLRARKRWEPRLDNTGFHQQPEHGRDLLVLHHGSSAGTEFRMRLTERTNQGTWRTQLTVSVPKSSDPWIALQVGNSEGRWAAVPGLATNLLDTLQARDGLSVVSPDALVVTQSNVEDFLERLTDPRRRGLMFVAATATEPFDFEPFARQVGRWVREVRGLGQMAVLSPDATDVVSDALGESHAIAPWTLRTFYPEVDPAIRSDGYRHKWLTTERLGKEPDRAIQQLLGRIARRHAYLRPPLDGYASVDRVLRRLEDRRLVESLVTPVDAKVSRPADAVEVSASLDLAPPTAPPAKPSTAPEPTPSEMEVTALREENSRLARLLAVVEESLGVEEVTAPLLTDLASKAAKVDAVAGNLQVFTEQLAEREVREAELEARVLAMQESFDDAQIDVRESGETAARLADENRYLKQRLAEKEDFEAAFGVIPGEAYTRYPESFDELLRRRDEFECAGVLFTGDPDEMIAMDEHDTLNNAVRAAWDGLLALGDYLRARSEGVCTTGIREYLRETPSGYRSMPTNKFGGKETKETMNRWGSEREFPVPVEVAPSGFAVMEAHFKLAPIGMVSPRMYFLDCYSATGKAYVGYIGAHLTNTQS